MDCKILKSFPFSRDGVTTHNAATGETVDVPDHLVPGLKKEGLLEVKDAGPSQENKNQGGPDENKGQNGDDRETLIRTAISALSEESFTKEDKPEVDAINELLADEERPVSAAERDEVWAKIEAESGE